MMLTLTPNLETIKALFRVYALADGRELFHIATPKIASQTIQPHADQVVQTIKTRTNSAFLAGSARFGMMATAGIVDFFGPIGGEKPAESVLRMGKELLNGSFALTTRLANLMVGPASTLPSFENNAAWTEWMWSAAGYLVGARSFMNGRATPAPMTIEFARPAFANASIAMGVDTVTIPKPFPQLSTIMMMQGKDGESQSGVPHKTSGHIPDRETLQSAYLRFKGKVVEIAAHLNVTRAAVYGAIDRFGLRADLPIRSRRSHPEKVSARALPTDNAMAIAYAKHKYNWTAVADEFGISYATIYQRIDKALGNGPTLLKLLIEVQRGIGHITDNHIVAVLMAHELDLHRSAGFLRMTPKEIITRARNAPYDSNLHLMQGLKPK